MDGWMEGGMEGGREGRVTREMTDRTARNILIFVQVLYIF
jgi:hypothetical protein